MRNDKLMSRSLTQTFISFRDKYSKFNDRNSGSIEMKKSNNLTTSEQSTPEWLFMMEEINYMIKSLEFEINYIMQLYQDHLTKPVFNDDIRPSYIIDRTYGDITKKLRICYDKTHKLNNYCLKETFDNNTYKNFVNNVISHIFIRIRDLSSTLGQRNKVYLQHLNIITKKSDEYFQIPIDEESNQKQISITIDNDSNLENVKNVNQGVENLNHIIISLSHMVNNNSQVIDRIDQHIELASSQVEATLNQLTTLEKSTRFSFKKAAYFTLLFIIIITLVISIFTTI